MFNVKSVVFIVLLLLSFSTSALSPRIIKEHYYTFTNDEIHAEVNYKKITVDANIQTFQVSKASAFYATDKNHVFYMGKKLDHLNPNETLFIGGKTNDVSVVIAKAGYIKDKNNVYFEDKWIEGADAETFELFNHIKDDVYAKDKNTVYLNEKRLIRDPNTFKLLKNNYSLDKNGVYFKENNVEDASINDINIFNNQPYLISNNHVFFYGKKTILDPDTSTILTFPITSVRDKNNIYILNQESFFPLNPEDKDSFIFLGDTFRGKNKNEFYNYAKDDKNYYKMSIAGNNIEIKKVSKQEILDKLNINNAISGLEDLNIANVETLRNNPFTGEIYTKDDKNVFFNNKKIQGADAKTFSVLTKNSRPYDTYVRYVQMDTYSKDKNTVYLNGEITNYDSNTFKILESNYFSDKNGVYFKGEKLKDANPNNVLIKNIRSNSKSVFDFFLISNNHIFLNGEKIPIDAKSYEIIAISSVYQMSFDTLASALIKDKNGIHLIRNNSSIVLLEIPHPSSFKLISQFSHDFYAKDLFNYYHINFYYNYIDIEKIEINDIPLEYREKQGNTLLFILAGISLLLFFIFIYIIFKIRKYL